MNALQLQADRPDLSGQELAKWYQAIRDWELEVVERPSGTRGFSVVHDGLWSKYSAGFQLTEEGVRITSEKFRRVKH